MTASLAPISDPRTARQPSRRISPLAPESWNQPAIHGPEANPYDSPEHARYNACADLLRKHAPAGSVLEIGCGEALLMQHVQPEDYQSWLGVDISEVAIERARKFNTDRIHYVTGNVNKPELLETYDAIVFDAIVFSESLYYAPEPASLLRQYARYLNPNGVFLISIFDEKAQAPVWQEIYSVARPLDFLVATSTCGTWICEVLRMR